MGFEWDTTTKEYARRNKAKMMLIAQNTARRMDKYVPFDTGTLKNNISYEVSDNTAYITYDTSYAAANYYNHKGDGARGDHWDQRMLSSEQTQWEKENEKIWKNSN